MATTATMAKEKNPITDLKTLFDQSTLVDRGKNKQRLFLPSQLIDCLVFVRLVPRFADSRRHVCY